MFKITDEAQLSALSEQNIHESSVNAEKIMVLKSFQKFQDMTDALSESTALVEGEEFYFWMKTLSFSHKDLVERSCKSFWKIISCQRESRTSC